LLNPDDDHNTFLTDELIKTSEVRSAHEVLHALETRNHQAYFKTLQQCDYLIACAILPYLDEMRQTSVNELLSKMNGRIENLEHFWNGLFFDSEDNFVDFLRYNKMKIVTK
jgi:tRNA nucleotidyltransferase/poly(A) polymerase